jgi:hypothetical protein
MDIYIYPLRAATPERGIFWAERVFLQKVGGKHWKLGTFWRQEMIHRKPLETMFNPPEMTGSRVNSCSEG